MLLPVKYFYRVPVEDPMADAFAQAYPEIFLGIEEMPQDLREHLRYPRSLLDLQSDVLLQYHQETAEEFHGQQDVGTRPRSSPIARIRSPTFQSTGSIPCPTRKCTVPVDERFVPAGRENLTAMLVARTDTKGTPEMILMDVPVDDEVLGPRLIEARLEQDPVIFAAVLAMENRRKSCVDWSPASCPGREPPPLHGAGILGSGGRRDP